MRYRLTVRAEHDLREIYRHSLAAFGERQAETYLRELDAVFDLLNDHPSIGRTYHGATRQFVHGSHIILYRVAGQRIVVGRIFHGAQRRSPP